MTDTFALSGWHQRAAALTAQLADADVLTDPRWRAAFEQIPRHLFVPCFYRADGTPVLGSDPATAEEWLSTVYSDDSLVVQRAPVPGVDRELATSSSTMPSLMARMLHLLDVDDASRVLEIGTATGYNAALLCHRLGAEQVTSVELHPELAATAAQHLARLGLRPALAVGDGTHGVPDHAPYDRILATCAVPAIPPAWIEQLTLGGRIVTDLRSEMSSSLAVLDKTTPDTVQGRLLDQSGHFMWLRPDPASPLLRPGDMRLVIHHDGNNDTRTTDLDLQVLAEPGLRTLLGILEPALQAPSRRPGNESDTWFLFTTDNSWAEITTGDPTHTVTEGGPRRIWPAVEQAVAEWHHLGRPGRGRYGLTASTKGTHDYWLNHPDQHVLADTTVQSNE